MKQINVRLDDDVHDMLSKQADATHRSLNGQIAHLIRKDGYPVTTSTSSSPLTGVAWRAGYIKPGTPYPDEDSVMIPPGWHVFGYFPENDDRDGADIVIRVEQASNPADHTGAALSEQTARAISEALATGGRPATISAEPRS